MSPIDFDAWRVIRGLVGSGGRLHLAWVQEKAPYHAERALCGVGPVASERSDWPQDWRDLPTCKNCERERARENPSGD
jgi:hypothetical protein